MSRFLAAYQAYMSKATDAPKSFVMAGGLACLSTIALSRRWLNKGNGVRPNVFLMLTADSSKNRKSFSVDTPVELLRDVEEDRVGPKDFTSEGLIFTMRKRPKGKSRNKLILPISEFGRYLAAAQSYAASTGAMLCDLYDGDDYERVRSGKRPLFVEKPRLSMLAAVAYGMLEKFADPKDWITGFFARIVWVMPETDPNRVRYFNQPAKPTAERDIAKAALIDLREELRASKGAMAVSAQADAVFDAFAKPFAAQEVNDPVLEAQRERLLNTIWKVAMLFQIDENPQHPVGPQAMSYAIWFAQQAWTSFQKIYAKTASSPFIKLAHRVHHVAWHADGHTIPMREIYRTLHLSAEHLARVLDMLVKADSIEVAKSGRAMVVRALCEPPQG